MPKLVHRKQLPIKQKKMGKGGKNERKHVLKVIHVKGVETWHCITSLVSTCQDQKGNNGFLQWHSKQ